MAKPKKKKFEVTEQQTIDAVLQQMKEEGYLPVRRMEEPIFMEKKGKWVNSDRSVREKNRI